MYLVRRALLFEGARGPDGRVRAGVWDYVCIPGHDEKDGQSTDFSLETLSQMIDNFVERGDPVPIDFNHQSNYAHLNGQPAPALGWYTALAVVWDGAIVKMGVSSGETGVTVEAPGLSPETCDLARPGLWAYRGEVTELGQELLPNFKLLSPTFMANGTRRDGTEVGYCLAAVAATNTPWQSGTEITFDRASKIDGAACANQENRMAAKLSRLAAFAGVGEDADDKAIKQGIMARMSKMATDVAMDEGDMFAYDDEASKLEDAAKCYEDAHFEDDGEDPSVTMRKMASKFRKLGKMAGGNSEGPRPGAEPGDPASPPAAAAAEPNAGEGKRTGEDNKMAAFQATIAAMSAKLAGLEAEKAQRETAARKEREQRFDRLADQAVAGGYPKEARAALIAFARTDEAGARAIAAPFLPKTGAPAHLFDRVSRQGGPIDGPTSAREDGGGAAPKRRVVTNGFARWVEMDSGYADEIKRVAESEDPAVKAKVNKHIHASRQGIMFDRLQAATKIVRAERPDLAEAAEAE